MMDAWKVDELEVRVFPTAEEMGVQAAEDVVECISTLLETQDTVGMIFAAAPSQDTFLKHFIKSKNVDWARIDAFHMDEYIGLPKGAQQTFGRFLSERLFDLVSFRRVYLIDPIAQNADAECERYASVLNEAPIDIVVLGIGENGHIAFNDPPVADFNDPLDVKIVELDVPCRVQQVNDGAFLSFDAVPKEAITLTVPRLMNTAHAFCIVPGQRKRSAVNATLNGDVSTDCPATALRSHVSARLYLDSMSGSGLAPG